MKDTNNNELKKELYFLLDIAIILLGILLLKVNLFLSIILGILFLLLCAYAITNRSRNKIFKVILSVFSPFSIVATYIWILYLLKDTGLFWTRLHSSFRYFFLFGIILDIWYCKSIPETCKDRTSAQKDNVYSDNACEFPDLRAATDEPTSVYTHVFNSNCYDIADFDPYLIEAGKLIIYKRKASIGMLQRAFKIGLDRATAIMEELAKIGVVRKNEDRSWKVILNEDEFEKLIENILTGNTNPNFYHFTNHDYHFGHEELVSCDQLDGYGFERFCADILAKNNFYNIELTPGSGDQGIDVIAYKDGIKYGIQCKRYSSDVGNSAVQEAFSGKVFYNCHVAVVLTNRYFTHSAKELAEKNGVLLWDRDKLDSMISNIK